MVIRTVGLIARRELNAKLRTRSFVIGTAVSLVVLVAFVLMQGSLGGPGSLTVGLNGQAIGVADQLGQAGRQLGREIRTREVTDLPAGERMVAGEELDALVSGPPAQLSVLVRDELNQDLRVALDAIVQQEVLRAQLAAIEDLDANQVLENVAAAQVGVKFLRGPDSQRGERLAVALLIIALLYVSLVFYGNLLAQGVIEEKSSRVVELLLATVRPWQLLAGKVLGLGLVGLIQLAVLGVAGLTLASVTGVLTIPGSATGSVLWGLLWYLLGFALYATVFAAVGSLVSRQEDAQPVIMPVTLVLLVAFVLGFSVLARNAASTASTVLSLVPLLSPVLMPGKIALGAAPGWQIGAALGLTIAAIVLLTALGGRIYRNAVLHMGSRLRLRDALR
ncbi:ABC transporter permease [Actinophytocola sp.]|uniref:ABC transporter permease n=1 Tax=Actinophytocola sp. TaxID=1872138 RepID=UPI0039C85730